MNAVILILASVGLNFILTEGYVFNRPREVLRRSCPDWIGELSSCPQCMGFWTGMIVEILARWFAGSSVIPEAPTLMALFLAGCATSAVSVAVVSVRR